MEINIAKLSQVVTGIVVVAAISGTVYFLYTVFFGGPRPAAIPAIEQVSPGLFGPKGQKSAAALADPTQKILVGQKDLAFTQTPLFKSFIDLPDVVPLTGSRGRPDPFVPLDTYAAP